MAHYAAWFRREDYQRIREIMVDGNGLPALFDDWERKAKQQVAEAKAGGIVIQPVILDPEKFTSFCAGKKIPHDREARAAFAAHATTAKGMN